jgi:DNA repair protein SbcD/Mre11
MLFAHLSDCHIGGWREEKLRKLNLECFKEAVNIVLKRNVDFVLISGDLFNTAIPQIDYIKDVTSEIKKVKDADIPIYVVAGSHDYSPSGKTMLDVLENAGLVQNVMKIQNDKLSFTIDPKTGAKIVGMYGRRGGLEIKDYQNMNYSHLDSQQGFKIFLFHTAINEFKPAGLEEMQGASAATLPQNFHYYAGGHVHYIFQKEFGKGWLTFPGALFPNNFKEIEEWQHGGLYLVNEKVEWEYVPIKLKDVATVKVNVDSLTPEQATEKIVEACKQENVTDKIVTIRIEGKIEGKTSDIDYAQLTEPLSSAYHVLRNTAKLKSKEIEAFQLRSGTVKEIEQDILEEIEAPVKLDQESNAVVRALMQSLEQDRGEGEKVAEYERRMLSEGLKVLELET